MLEKYLNKITCGDCYKLIRELPGKSVDLIVTDPPYQMDEHGGGKEKSKYSSNPLPTMNKTDI